MVHFVVNGKKFVEASNKVGRIVNHSTINIDIGNGMLMINASNEMHNATHIVPAKTLKSGKIAIDKKTIDSILRGREDIEIRVKNNMLSFADKQSNYAGSDILTLPADDEVIEEPKFKNSSWKPELQNSIVDAMQDCTIQSFYEAEQLPIILEKRKNMLIVASADQFHVAFSQIVVDKDLEFKNITIPSSYVNIISLFKNEPFKLTVNDSNIKISTSVFSCTLPALQTADNVGVDDILGLLSLDTKPSYKGKINIDNLKQSLENLQVVYEAGAGTNLVYKNGHIHISLQTTYGKTNDSIKVGGDGKEASIILNSENLDDLLSKVSGTVQMIWYSNWGAHFKKTGENGTTVEYFVAAYSDSASEKIKAKSGKGDNKDENDE